jgi:acyl-CoA synthetase (AMP-forming)/AMP-acid ligase II
VIIKKNKSLNTNNKMSLFLDNKKQIPILKSLTSLSSNSETTTTNTTNSSNNNNTNIKKSNDNKMNLSHFYYHQVGMFLTQFKIRENYNFLQMISSSTVVPLDGSVKPKPEGEPSVPTCGEPLIVPKSFPQSIEAALHKFANASNKTIAISVLDQNGKTVNSLTYGKPLIDPKSLISLKFLIFKNKKGKLLSRSNKVAYHLLNKVTVNLNGEQSALKIGDRVALVFPNTDPIGFTISFCACLMAGLVALPIDLPLGKRDAGTQNIGFLLNQVNANVALTSELCYKSLPRNNNNNELIDFKGWPKLNWIVIENITKSVPKDWQPQSTRLPSETIAYIEYSILRDGSVTGVCVTRDQMLVHSQTLHMVCQYSEGQHCVCVLDFKREFGLWHGIQSTLFNGMQMIYVPYSIMKINPGVWLTAITKYKASIGLVKSRDMHWGLMGQTRNDPSSNEVNLETLRLLLVADGANPWSLSSCDSFFDAFQSKGLKSNVICPTAGSSETMTISIRRRIVNNECDDQLNSSCSSGSQSTGRGVLSMAGLSYGVVRVDNEDSLTSLTLQDVGQVLPGTVISIIRINNNNNNETSVNQTSVDNSLCQTDEIGEICISSKSTGECYYGLKGLTSNTFKIIPHGSKDGLPIGTNEFVRSNLLGFMGPSGLIFVCGSKEGLIDVSGRKHNTDDIIATVLAVEPMKFIYRGRITVFSIRVLKDERIVIIAEQRPDASEEDCFQWMSRVLQAVDSIHHVGVYCLALVPPNTLPKTPLGTIHVPEAKCKFLEGNLHPSNVLMCPHTCILNLPKPREHHPEREVGPGAVLAGSIVQGRRLAEAKGRDICDDDMDTAKKYQFLGDILRWRSATSPDHILYTLINAKGHETQKMTCSQLHKKAEKLASVLVEKGQLISGDHIALLFPPGIDLIIAFYACLFIGVIPVPIRPPYSQNIQTTLPTIKMIIEMSKVKAILSTNSIIKLLKSKDANAIIDSRQWPMFVDIDDSTKKKLTTFYRPDNGDSLCFLDFSVSTTGMLAGIQINHSCSTSLCRAIKLSCELYPSREVVLCLDPYSGLGFVLWCLNSIYSGHHSILVPPSEVESNPCIWLATVSHFKVRDTFCSYSVMELCTKGLQASIVDLKVSFYISFFSLLFFKVLCIQINYY